MTTAVNVDAVVAEADREYPALYQLFGGYFHEDWRDESGTAENAIRSYAADAPVEAVSAARDELDRLLGSGLDEAQLSRVLESGFGCMYAPSSDGITTADWLTSARALLQQPH